MSVDPPYKFRCTLNGHSSDVRSLVCATRHLIFSASRDFTSRTWRVSHESPHGIQELVMHGHGSYVSSVTASTEQTDGPILFTGSHDKMIRAYTLTDPEPLYALSGHEDNVCTLAPGPGGVLVSGSWDSSAMVWKDKRCVLSIKGHESAVWSVLTLSKCPIATDPDFILLTGSADHTIKVWRIHPYNSFDYTEIKTLVGHTDCVRSLTSLSGDLVLSASNDASIRAWHLTSGQCVGEFYGHTSFVYSVAARPGAPIFVSSGEDRCVRVWLVPGADEWGPGRQFETKQCIPFPCQSVWCVALTEDLDIVAGGSDSCIRMFSREPARQASLEASKAYEAELSNTKISAPEAAATGDLDLTKLPGIEALAQPGKREGHVIVIQQDGRQVCYQWSAVDSRWIEVGDVVGTGASKLPIYNGKEYDFVFSVDISDDISHLKLPYNRTEDPWVVAQRFIHEHDLPQDYLETIANFIIRNAGPQLNPAPSADIPTDPFTGSSRYVPSSLYSLPSRPDMPSDYFPATNFIPLKSISLAALLGKLESFNALQNPENRLLQSELHLLRAFSLDLSGDQAVTLAKVLMEKIPKWSTDNVFPLLDLLRCLVFWPSASDVIFSTSNWKAIYACSFGDTQMPPANCLLVVRLLANALAANAPAGFSPSKDSSAKLAQGIITPILLVKELDNMVHGGMVDISERKPLQVAVATYVLNLSVFSHLTSTSSPDVAANITSSIPFSSVLPSLCIRISLSLLSVAPSRGAGAVTLFHPDAVYALLLAVGTAMLTATQKTSDAEATKAHRVRLLASALATSESDGAEGEDVEAGWTKVRSSLSYWANTPTCGVKVRRCASALLQLLE